MRRDGEKQHSIDILFLVVIFLVFTFSALSALLLAVNFYQTRLIKVKAMIMPEQQLPIFARLYIRTTKKERYPLKSLMS